MDRNAHTSGRAAAAAWLARNLTGLSALPLRTRLLASFALVLVLMLGFGAFALVQMAGLNRDTRDIAGGWLPRAQLAAAMKIEAIGMRVAQFQFIAVEADDAGEEGYVGVVDKTAQAEADIAHHRQALATHRQAFEKLLADEDQRAQYAAFVQAWDDYEASGELFMGMVKDGLREVAMAMLTEQSRQQFEDANAALDALMAQAAAGATAASERSASNYAATRGLALLSLLLAAALAASAALWLVRQTMRQLGGDPATVQHVVERIAVGDLGVRISLADGDQSSLLAATRRMQAELQRLAAELRQLHAQHDRGMLAHRIDSAAFAGVYGELAAAVNALAATHIGVSEQVVAIIQRYAVGDFSADMPRLPGEQARITEAVDGVKHQLGAIKDETLRLADAAGRGEFSLRGDAAAFQFAFRDIVEGLNRLMGTAESGLRSVGEVLEGLAAGDLTRRMHGDFQGRFAELQRHAGYSLDQLAAVVQRIQQASQLIESASSEIAAGNQDLSARTEAQASNLEETASSIEELAGVVAQNAANAREAKQLASNAGEVARRGGEVVAQVVGTMGAIAQSSHRIADIIGVIDGIAFQTNILALNAAVEAARAGEQGRGFAVVATEVRALAQRSASAAKEIKDLITASVQQVATGAELVDDAGRTMQDIVAAVQRVDNIMADIANGAAEQSAGIAQVNQAIAQIDGATQQNAALVEEAAAAARSLTEEAGELRSAAASFRLA